MSCVLSIVGENLDVDDFVKKTRMPGFDISYKGDSLGVSAHRKKKFSGASIVTSSKDFDDLKGQIEDTARFLNEHKNNLKVIASTANIDHAIIDFGIDSIINENQLTQTFRFPKDLIELCAELRLEIEVSIYKEDIQIILEERYQGKK